MEEERKILVLPRFEPGGVGLVANHYTTEQREKGDRSSDELMLNVLRCHLTY